MNEPFEIIVPYKGENLSFNARLIRYGYTHRIIVSVSGTDVVFEPDEEKNYRALIDSADTAITDKQPEVDLLGVIAETIEQIVR
jgi:hypothetical protein